MDLPKEHYLLEYHSIGRFEALNHIKDIKRLDLPENFQGALNTRVAKPDGSFETMVTLLGFPNDHWLAREKPSHEGVYNYDVDSPSGDESVHFPANRLEELKILASGFSNEITLDDYLQASSDGCHLYSLPYSKDGVSGKHFVVRDENNSTISEAKGVGLDAPRADLVDGKFVLEDPVAENFDQIVLIAKTIEGGFAGSRLKGDEDPNNRQLASLKVTRNGSLEETIDRELTKTGWDTYEGFNNFYKIDEVHLGSGAFGAKAIYVGLANGKLAPTDDPQFHDASVERTTIEESEISDLYPRLGGIISEGLHPREDPSIGDRPTFIQSLDPNSGAIDTTVCRDSKLLHELKLNRFVGPVADADGKMISLVDLHDWGEMNFSRDGMLHKLPFAVPGEDKASFFIDINKAGQVTEIHKGTGEDAPIFMRPNKGGPMITTERKICELAAIRGDEPEIPDFEAMPSSPNFDRYADSLELPKKESAEKHLDAEM